MTIDSRVVEQTEHAVLNRWTAHTPEGELWQERYYLQDDPDTLTRKWIKELETELHMLKYVFRIPCGYSRETIRVQKASYITADGQRSAGEKATPLHTPGGKGANPESFL